MAMNFEMQALLRRTPSLAWSLSPFSYHLKADTQSRVLVDTLLRLNKGVCDLIYGNVTWNPSVRPLPYHRFTISYETEGEKTKTGSMY